MFGRRNVSVTAEGWYFLLVVLFIVTASVMREVNLLIILAGMLIGPWLLQLVRLCCPWDGPCRLVRWLDLRLLAAAADQQQQSQSGEQPVPGSEVHH